jgi:hypothetical protein
MRFFVSPWRISGFAGLLFVVLSLLASAMNVQPPSYNQAPPAVMSWFAENSQRFRLGHFIAGIAFLLFYFPFFAGLCERLRAAEGAPVIWSRVVWAGAIMSPAAGTTSGSFMIGAALLGERVSPDVAAFGTASNFYAFVVSGALTGIVMIGTAVVIIRTAVFSRWLGWAGALVGLAAIVGCAAILENNPAGLFATINAVAWLAYFLWLLAMSIALIQAPDITATI